MRTGSLMIYALFVFCSCASSKFTETDLYFGLSKPGGGVINDTAWDNFVTSYVAKVYPQGFTMVKSEGKWLDKETNITISEPSRIIVAVNKMNRLLSLQIDSLTIKYKLLFNQQAVLRVDKKLQSVSF